MKLLLPLFAAASLGGWLARPDAAPETPGGPTATPPVSALEASTFAIDPAHSAVVFRTKHLGISTFWGRFNKVEGTIRLDEDDLADSSIEVEIEAASVDTGSADRDKHLRSPDFFSVKEFPAITFASTRVEGGLDALKITGRLELHGVTKEVTAEAALVGQGETFFGDYRAGFEARFALDMTDFDIGFVKNRPGAVGPEVEVILGLECIRQ